MQYVRPIKRGRAGLAAAIAITALSAFAMTIGRTDASGPAVPSMRAVPSTVSPAQPGSAAGSAAGSAGGTTGVLWGVSTGSLYDPARIYTIDPTSGEATLVAEVDNRNSFRVGASFLADVLYATDILGVPGGGMSSTVSIDLVTGDPTLVSDQDGSTAWEGMGSNESAGVLYTLDARDGTNTLLELTSGGIITPVGTGTGLQAMGLAYDDANGILYALNDADDSLYTIDTTDGTAQLVGPLNVFILGSAGLAYDEDTQILYMNTRDDLYRVDTGTGNATEIGPNLTASIDGLAWQPGEQEPDPCGIGCPCIQDINGDLVVDFADILPILAAWGSCDPRAQGPAPGLLCGLASGTPGRLYTLDPATGEATSVTALNGTAEFTGLTFLDDILYASDLYGYPGDSGAFDTGSIDKEVGTITFLNDQDYSANWHGLAANETDGVLYSVAFDLGGDPLYRAAPDGTVEQVGPTGITVRGLAYDDPLGILYAVDSDDNLYKIDTDTAVATLVGELGVDTNFRPGLAFDENTRTLFLNIAGGPDGNALYIVDTGTGAAELVGFNGVSGIDGLAWGTDFSACDDCPCPADVTRDGVVDFADIVSILAVWGPCE